MSLTFAIPFEHAVLCNKCEIIYDSSCASCPQCRGKVRIHIGHSSKYPRDIGFSSAVSLGAVVGLIIGFFVGLSFWKLISQ